MRPCCYDPATSIFSGMTPDQLRAQLAEAQAAYLRLCTGGQGVSYSYMQNDAARLSPWKDRNVERTPAPGKTHYNLVDVDW
jgi:hypothetical protein